MNISNSYNHKLHNILLYPSYNETMNIKLHPEFQIIKHNKHGRIQEKRRGEE